MTLILAVNITEHKINKSNEYIQDFLPKKLNKYCVCHCWEDKGFIATAAQLEKIYQCLYHILYCAAWRMLFGKKLLCCNKVKWISFQEFSMKKVLVKRMCYCNKHENEKCFATLTITLGWMYRSSDRWISRRNIWKEHKFECRPTTVAIISKIRLNV